jgi:aspartate/methionine/tyrosine aminotransferase
MSAALEAAAHATAAARVLVAARALEAEGRHIVHLEVGEPDAATPGHIVEAGVRALRDGHTRYAPPAGIPELRAAIAASVRSRGVVADAERVVVTPGAKSMLFSALLATVRPGDEVLVPDPGYPMYAAVAELAGGRVVRYALDAASGFAVNADEIAGRITARTRLLVLNAPHNPTGSVPDEATTARLAELALRHDLLVVSDEIYSRHRYDVSAGVQPSIAALPGMAERTVLVDGFSKSYAMTGWRLGYGVLPARLVKPVTTLVTNSATCTATFVQHAGVAALTGPQDWVARQVASLRERRDWLVAALGGLEGVACARPEGAFYVFPNVARALEGSGRTVASLADALLHEHGLACLPGTAVGPAGEGHLRLSYAASQSDLRLAVERLGQALGCGLSALGKQ